MTDGPPVPQPDAPDLETILMGQLDWAIGELHALVKDLERGIDGAGSESERKRAVARLRDFLSQVTKERSLVQELRLRDAGGTRDGHVFDFGEIRREIRGRLARLAAAGDAGQVP